MKDFGPLLFKEKQVRILVALSNDKEWHISNLAKETDVTYLHTSRFVSRCEQLGIVTSEKHGRTKRLVLTDKGKEIAKGLTSIIDKVNTPVEQPAAVEKEKPK